MSIEVDKKSIDKNTEQLIFKFLVFRENKKSNVKLSINIVAEPINGFINAREKVYIPLCFGKKLMGENYKNPNEKNWKTADIDFTGKLFCHQIDVADTIESKLRATSGSVLGLYPGFGKTVVGAYIASKIKMRTAIVFTQKVLDEQWLKTFQNFTKTSIWSCNSNKQYNNEDVLLLMVGSISKLSDDVRSSIGFLIIDEAHQFCTEIRFSSLLLLQPQFVLAETATLKREDGLELLIQSMCGFDGVFKSNLKPFTVVEIRTHISPEVKYNAQGVTDWSTLTKSLAESPQRQKLIIDLVHKHLDRKILILTSSKNLVQSLSSLLTEAKITNDTMFGNKKSYSDSNVLIGTYSKIGTGFDEANACSNFSGRRIDLVFLVFSTKNEALLEQNIGRAFRSEMPMIFDFIDKSTILSKHYSKRKKWYLSRGAQIARYDCPLSN